MIFEANVCLCIYIYVYIDKVIRHSTSEPEEKDEGKLTNLSCEKKKNEEEEKYYSIFFKQECIWVNKVVEEQIWEKFTKKENL